MHPRDRTAPSTTTAPAVLDRLHELVRRSGRGDPDAFASLYSCTAGYVTGLLQSSRPPERVEDLTVATYVALWTRCAEFDTDQHQIWEWLADQADAAGRADDVRLQRTGRD